MPQTTPDGLRYPSDLDTPDVPRDIKKLADDVQASLSARGPAPIIGPVASRPETLSVGQVFYGY